MKKTFITSLIVGLIGVSLIPLATAETELFPLLDSELQLNQSEYDWDERLYLDFTVENNLLYDVDLSFPDECLFEVSIGKVPVDDEIFEPLLQTCLESRDIPTALYRGWSLDYEADFDLSSLVAMGEGDYQVVVESGVTSDTLTEEMSGVFDVPPAIFTYNGGPAEINPITTTIWLETSKLDWSDDLVVNIRLENTQEEEATIIFNNGCYFDISIPYDNGVLDNVSDRFCTEALEEVSIPAGKALEWQEMLSLASMAAQPQGQYTVYVDVNGTVEGEWITNPALLGAERKFTLNGNVELSVDLDRERYLKTKSVIGTWTLTNNGETSYILPLSECTPSLDLYYVDTNELADPLDWNCDDTITWFEILPGETYSEKISIFPSLLRTFTPDNYYVEFNLLDTWLIDSPEFELYVTAFTDIQQHWGKTYIEALQQTDAVSGYERGKFRPNQPVTRAEFLKMAFIGLGYEIPTDLLGNMFDDSRPGDWHYSYVESAYRANLVQGYGNSMFRPHQPITRAEAITVLMKLEELDELETVSPYTIFLDVGRHDWFAHYVLVAYDLGIIDGYGNKRFGPHDLLTRAQAAKIIINLRNL